MIVIHWSWEASSPTKANYCGGRGGYCVLLGSILGLEICSASFSNAAFPTLIYLKNNNNNNKTTNSSIAMASCIPHIHKVNLPKLFSIQTIMIRT